jgi:predicted PurR-regulated permease PerM
MLEKLRARLGARRRLAIPIMSTALLLVVIVPLMFGVLTIAQNAGDIKIKIKSFDVSALSAPPTWLDRVPLVGEKMSQRWADFGALSPEEREAKITPCADKALQWFVARAGSSGRMLLDFLLSMIATTILYMNGEAVREGLLRFAARMAGRHGEDVACLAAKTIRGVTLGIIVTALVQAAVGCIGLLIVGIPAAGLLTAVMLILCLAQLGPLLVLGPSVVWLYWSGQAFRGTILLIISIFAGTIDSVLRPWLIRKGAELSLLLILVGVIGGLIAFGIIGLFLGPVVLATAYTLLKAWVLDQSSAENADSSAAP